MIDQQFKDDQEKFNKVRLLLVCIFLAADNYVLRLLYYQLHCSIS